MSERLTHLECPCCGEPDALPGRPGAFCYAHEGDPRDCPAEDEGAEPCDLGHGWLDGDQATCPRCGCLLVSDVDYDEAWARVLDREACRE